MKKYKLQDQVYSRIGKPLWASSTHKLESMALFAWWINIFYGCMINLNHTDYKSIRLFYRKYQRDIWLRWFRSIKNQIRRQGSHSRHGLKSINYWVVYHFDPEIFQAIKQSSEDWLCNTSCHEFCGDTCASNVKLSSEAILIYKGNLSFSIVESLI